MSLLLSFLHLLPHLFVQRPHYNSSRHHGVNPRHWVARMAWVRVWIRPTMGPRKGWLLAWKCGPHGLSRRVHWVSWNPARLTRVSTRWGRARRESGISAGRESRISAGMERGISAGGECWVVASWICWVLFPRKGRIRPSRIPRLSWHGRIHDLSVGRRARVLLLLLQSCPSRLGPGRQ